MAAILFRYLETAAAAASVAGEERPHPRPLYCAPHTLQLPPKQMEAGRNSSALSLFLYLVGSLTHLLTFPLSLSLSICEIVIVNQATVVTVFVRSFRVAIA